MCVYLQATLDAAAANERARARLTKPITIKVYWYTAFLYPLIYNDKQEFIIFQCYDPHQPRSLLYAQRQTGCSVAPAGCSALRVKSIVRD